MEAWRRSNAKRFQMVAFRGSTQEKSASGIFRFDYEKAASDKKVPGPVGSAAFLYYKKRWLNLPFRDSLGDFL